MRRNYSRHPQLGLAAFFTCALGSLVPGLFAELNLSRLQDVKSTGQGQGKVLEVSEVTHNLVMRKGVSWFI